MKLLLSFFIFLIGFFAPAQAGNFAIPTQIGSYSNPIEPIKPKAENKSYKFKNKPIENKLHEEEESTLNTFIGLGLGFLVGLILFSNGFVQGVMLLFWLGLGLEVLSLLGLLIAYFIIINIPDWEGAAFMFVSSFFIPIALFIKGLALIILGLTAAMSITWIIGISLSVLAIALFVFLISTISIF